MSTLPKIIHPTFTFSIPSTGQEVSLRPFLVKEEKIALIAAQVPDVKTRFEAMMQILSNCIVAPEKFSLETLTIFDFEYLFLKLRAISVSNILEVIYKPETGKPFQVRLDLNSVEVMKQTATGEWVVYDPKKDDYKKTGKTIMLTDTIGIEVRYPSIKTVLKAFGAEDIDTKVLFESTTRVFDADKVYTGFTQEDFEAFFNDLPPQSLTSVKDFFEHVPKIRWEGDILEQHVILEGLESFFG